MQTEQADIVDQAIGWHLRLTDADERQWADFIAWLEASPAHAAAYDTIAASDRLIEDAHFPPPVPAHTADNDNRPDHRRRLLLTGGALAAAAAAAAWLAPGMMARHSSPYVVATAAGERRTVALDDGTSIDLSGGTSVRLDRADPRVAVLDRGEAVFHVRHDDRHPFTMTAGGETIRDLGTVFNVARDGDALTVEVSEGSVLFRPESDAVRLGTGDALSVRGDGRSITRFRIAPDMVGGWRSGMLTFDNQRLGDVAATLKRLYSFDLRLEGSLSDRPFTGMVRFTGAADRDIPHLADLIGATWRRDGNRWTLAGSTPASR